MLQRNIILRTISLTLPACTVAAHAVDLATGEDFALGVFTQGGFEKIVEINPQNPNIVMFSLAGYNGAFDNFEKELQDRKDEYPHPEGGEWVWTKDVVPGRVYIGVKGVDEQGQPCDDFLCRNVSAINGGRV